MGGGWGGWGGSRIYIQSLFRYLKKRVDIFVVPPLSPLRLEAVYSSRESVADRKGTGGGGGVLIGDSIPVAGEKGGKKRKRKGMRGGRGEGRVRSFLLPPPPRSLPTKNSL